MGYERVKHKGRIYVAVPGIHPAGCTGCAFSEVPCRAARSKLESKSCDDKVFVRFRDLDEHIARMVANRLES